MRLGIGIDTGGTYTDAVIYDFEQQAIKGTAKVLTTHHDLSQGILSAIDTLPVELCRQAELISLSTTLATNACVEDRGGRAKLIFFGADPISLDRLGGEYGLPEAKDIYIQENYTDFYGCQTQAPDWSAFTQALQNGSFDGLDGVGIVEMNAPRNGAATEKKAKALFQRHLPIPVVCGHELYNVLNSLQRGASTLLNARLFPVIANFLQAVKKALAQREIQAPLVIMRSDGSLMSEDFASARPVETLLCGPAASAAGGTLLTGCPEAVIVDMGGTTTDIALVKGGAPVCVLDGVLIGKWKTFVNGLYIKTMGLGGDSAVHYGESKPTDCRPENSLLRLETYRVVPLCVAAARYPQIVKNLNALASQPVKHSRFLYEHYLLIKDISGDPRYTPAEQAFCQSLKQQPLSLTQAAKAIGRDLYSLPVSRLLQEGVIQLSGLTPTDVMHCRGDFTAYNAEASRLAVSIAAFNTGMTLEAFCEGVYDEIKRKLYVGIVKILLEQSETAYQKSAASPEAERMIHFAYDAAQKGKVSGILAGRFATDFKLVGIGAPIGIFLPEVAALLGTAAVIHTHHAVANALGAIAGGVDAHCQVEIKPAVLTGGLEGYTVYGITGRQAFKEFSDAEAFARQEAAENAQAEARRRGAKGTLSVTTKTEYHQVAGKNGTLLNWGATVAARAVGAIRD